jgi:hypothetical protein
VICGLFAAFRLVIAFRKRFVTSER